MLIQQKVSNDEFYQQAKKYLQADEKGTIPFNALSPRFIDVYLKLYIHPLDALEVDFYWIKNSSKTTDEELTMSDNEDQQCGC